MLYSQMGKSRAQKIEEMINSLSEDNMIGSLTDNKEYILETLEMKWGYYDYSQQQIIYLGYENNDLLLGLAGSKHNLIVEPKKGRTSSHSLTVAMLNWFYKNIKDGLPKPTKASLIRHITYESLDEYDIANAIYLATHQMSGETLRFHFLAKVLHRSHWEEGFRGSIFKDIVLATPLYISIDV